MRIFFLRTTRLNFEVCPTENFGDALKSFMRWDSSISRTLGQPAREMKRDTDSPDGGNSTNPTEMEKEEVPYSKKFLTPSRFIGLISDSGDLRKRAAKILFLGIKNNTYASDRNSTCKVSFFLFLSVIFSTFFKRYHHHHSVVGWKKEKKKREKRARTPASIYEMENV
jgi:hypothetical protein